MKPPTPAQKQARMNNFCIRCMLGLMYSFNAAGHNDFSARIEDILIDFRYKLEKKNGPE